MLPELTTKQHQLVTYLQQHITRRGNIPSLRQIAADLGVSHSAVAQMMKTLQDKGIVRREGRYSRTVHLLNRASEPSAPQRWREVPIVGRVTAGLPMYAQQEWDGSLVVDEALFRGANLFALRIRGDSMTGAGILHADLAICQPRQYAHDGEIVVALLDGEEATVKRFYHHRDHIELRPANPRYATLRYDFSRILIQGKVIGIQRGPGGIDRPSGEAGQ
jgi:repressor LexA